MLSKDVSKYKLMVKKPILIIYTEKMPFNQVSPLFQYFEYTSQKEIRYNSVTELCAEVLEGQTSVGMTQCPRDGEFKPPSMIWEFRNDGTIYHPHSDMCVTAYYTADGHTDIQMSRCNPGDKKQGWKFEHQEEQDRQ
uniref:polypeptide N-acetylgalactosaminyltransferase 4-like n=1 Tax=Monopterus albus TaxID=43700 RepID=UPI0009B3EFBC|nr:polypeptide N-acetylgalactosaminyltransferase 4-like [Monopterus albus]